MGKFKFTFYISVVILGMSCAPIGSAPSSDNPDEVTRQKIDLSNLTQNDMDILSYFQTNASDLKMKQEAFRANASKEKPNPGPLPSSIKLVPQRNSTQPSRHHKGIQTQAIQKIKQQLEGSLNRKSSGVTHEYAFPAICDMPKNTNESFWFEGLTWNLYFKAPEKSYTSVEQAVLRLYKLPGPNSTDTEKCKDEHDQLLKVFVSVYSRKNRKDNFHAERLKLLCSATNIPKSYKGWISMDILLAVKQWDKSIRNFGLGIDIRDQDDNQLKAAQFFQPPECKVEAYPPFLFPWTFYQHELLWPANEMENVPHHPRVDIRERDEPRESKKSKESRNFHKKHHYKSKQTHHKPGFYLDDNDSSHSSKSFEVPNYRGSRKLLSCAKCRSLCAEESEEAQLESIPASEDGSRLIIDRL